MKKYWLGLTLLALLVGYLVLRPKPEFPTVSHDPMPSENVDRDEHKITVTDKIKCIENSEYFVISQEVIHEDQGFGAAYETIIVAKTKRLPDQHFDCAYTTEKDDFVIRNEYPQYVLGLENKFLIVDNGTSPSIRPFLVYDLSTKKKIYSDGYDDDILNISSNKVEYWTQADDLTTVKNCPNPYRESGLIAGVNSRVELDLLTLTKRNLDQYRCTIRQ